MDLAIQILQLITAIISFICLILTVFKKDKNRALTNKVDISKKLVVKSVSANNHINSDNKISGNNNNISNVTNNYNLDIKPHTKTTKINLPVSLITALCIIISLLFSRYINIFTLLGFVTLMFLVTALPLSKKILWYISIVTTVLVNNFALYWNPWKDTIKDITTSALPIGDLIILITKGSKLTPVVLLMTFIPLAYSALYCCCSVIFIQYGIALKRKVYLKSYENNISVALFGTFISSILFVMLSVVFNLLYK